MARNLRRKWIKRKERRRKTYKDNIIPCDVWIQGLRGSDRVCRHYSNIFSSENVDPGKHELLDT